MFTGLIETTGTIREIQHANQSMVLGIVPANKEFPVSIGDSVAIDGVCLTLEKASGLMLAFRAVAETLKKTTLADIHIESHVNMERSLRPSDRIGGHFVLGHVDGTGKIIKDTAAGDSIIRTFEASPDALSFIAPKGSVAIDGISLTVVDVEKQGFSVSFIPYTLAHTTMGYKKAGQSVNIECDVLARYTARLLAQGRIADNDKAVSASSGESLESKLIRLGF
jgi:riboflavin synthase